MIETFIERYVIISLLGTHPILFPYNLIFETFGIIFGFIFILPIVGIFIRRIILLSIDLFRKIINWFRKWKEPVGWLSLFVALVGIIVPSTLNYIQFTEQEKVEIKLVCNAQNKLRSENNSVLVFTKCKLMNTGNKTVSIDSIEPTFYYSEEINLNRNRDESSYYKYPSKLPTSLDLPYKINPGEQVNFDTLVVIPIGWETIDKESDITQMFVLDLDTKIKEFSNCVTLEHQSDCFYKLTNKYIPNYIYETIKYPIGLGIQPINGVGIKAVFFDKEVEVEVNMLDNFYPISPNQDIPVLSRDSHKYRDNLSKNWYEKTYFYMVENSGNGTNFIGATYSYLMLILSIFGWFTVVRLFITRF